MCFRIAYINKFGKNNKTIQNQFKAKIKKKKIANFGKPTSEKNR